MRDSAGIDLMKSAIRAMVNTRSNQDKGVTKADILIELMESMAGDDDDGVAMLLNAIER